jgi:hypothetical protein
MTKGQSEFVWLREAPETFGPRKLVAASRAENKIRPFENPAKIPEKLEDRLALADAMFKQIFPPKPATEELRARIAEMLWSGELEAFGIQVAPSPGAEPERLPRHMFSDPLRIIWATSSVKKSGRHYEEIEVRRTAIEASSTSQADAPPTVSRRNGRPTKHDEILAVIAAIAADGFDLNSIHRKPACDRVRAEAKKRGFNPSIGYSESVIKRALNQALGQRK